MRRLPGDSTWPERRAYVADHPVVFWLGVGIAAAGLLGLLFPETASRASAALLPRWLETIFNVTYAIAGTGSSLSMLRGWRSLEAGSMALLSSGLLANFVLFIYLTHAAAPGAAFILTLAIGTGQRSYHLATGRA